MKKQIILIVFLFSNYCSFSQTYDRQYNPNYAYTIFEDEFTGNNIDLNKWRPGLIHREIGELIYSPLTHNVSDGKLELTMRHYPNCGKGIITIWNINRQSKFLKI